MTTKPKTYENEYYARCDLRDDGYTRNSETGVYTSKDGLIDAEIRQGPDGWYIVFSA